MAKSKRTSEVIKKRNLFFIISLSMWVGTALFMVLSIVSKITSKEAVEETIESTEFLSPQLKAILFSLSTTLLIAIVASIIIKDKIRTFVWEVCVVIAAILFKETGLYIVLGLWFVEEYIFHALYIRYKEKVSINKEIDLRYE